MRKIVKIMKYEKEYCCDEGKEATYVCLIIHLIERIRKCGLEALFNSKNSLTYHSPQNASLNCLNYH